MPHTTSLGTGLPLLILQSVHILVQLPEKDKITKWLVLGICLLPPVGDVILSDID